ncbi:MAG: radical SAM family RiPP maturation amino acid epimerase [Bacteroidota bacterium]
MNLKWAATLKTVQEGLDSGEIIKLMGRPENVDPAYTRSIARTKRFLERWTADPKFRELAAIDPQEACEQYQLKADPEEIRLLWDQGELKRKKDNEPTPLAVRRYESFIREKLEWRDIIRKDSHPSNPPFKNWRIRQIYRSFSELGMIKAHGIVHAPVVFELSKGCSVGCWFCGVAAPKLGDIWQYTERNAKFWRECLEVVKSIIGPAAARGFCYWASDPFDNPEYEKFLIDFHDILNNFPQTTTAIPQRNFDRTREFLALSESKQGLLERFSILSLGQLQKVFNAFTAEELLYVELVTQNKGALTGKAVAGRARLPKFKKLIDKTMKYVDPTLTSTIACVSGFLFNMVDQKVKLISPCNANDKWPLGYYIYDEQPFETPEELERIMNQMIEDHMVERVGPGMKFDIRKNLTFSKMDNGFELSTLTTKHMYLDKPIWQSMGKMFNNGRRIHDDATIGELAVELESKYEIPLAESLFYINQMFREGIFSAEPPWRPSPNSESLVAIETPSTNAL